MDFVVILGMPLQCLMFELDQNSIKKKMMKQLLHTNLRRKYQKCRLINDDGVNKIFY